jgi:hypothetical protein
MEDNTMLPKVMTIMPTRQKVEFFFFFVNVKRLSLLQLALMLLAAFFFTVKPYAYRKIN